MPFELIPVKDEATVHRFRDAYMAGFHASPDSITPILFPNGITPAVEAFQLDGLNKAIESDSNQRLFVIRETEANTDVGGARWVLNTTPKPGPIDTEKDLLKIDEEWSSQPAVEGMNADAFRAFRRTQTIAKNKYLGTRAHVYLWILATHPHHWRRGVGSIGLQWGIQRAEELGLPIYLESTGMGVGLYEKYGFVAKGDLGWDAREWGMEYPGRFTIMIREPQSKGTAAT